MWPYVQTKKKKLSNNHTGRSFAVVNDDWIGALCLRKSRKHRNRERKNTVIITDWIGALCLRNRESTEIEKEKIQEVDKREKNRERIQ